MRLRGAYGGDKSVDAVVKRRCVVELRKRNTSKGLRDGWSQGKKKATWT